MSNSKDIKEQYYIESVDNSDFEEVQKEYVYLQKDERGIYFLDRSGKREDVVLPYVPVLDDDSTVRILFKKKENEKNKRFKYALIDNDEKILSLLENKEARTAIGWRIKPNKKLQNIKKDSLYKSYIYARETTFFDEETKELIGSNYTLHKLVMTVFCKDAVKKYNKINKMTARSMHIDHLNNDEFDCRLRNLSIIKAKQNYESKKKIDTKQLLDSFCIYRPKNKKGEYVDKKKKYVMFLFLGNEKYKKIKDGKEYNITQANFIRYQGGLGEIVCGIADEIESFIDFYNQVFVKYGEQFENVKERNHKISNAFWQYMELQEKENEKVKLVLLARTNENIKGGDISFDNISTETKDFLKNIPKRGLVIQEKINQKDDEVIYELQSSQNIKVNSKNIVDILYPYIGKIFDL